jgi:hypothetical protein
MNTRNLDDGEQGASILAYRPTIRILLYTDDPDGITSGLDVPDLGIMINHLHAHAPTFASLDIQWLSRYSSNQKSADNKLKASLLKQYDEVWFFGIHQMNIERPTPGLLRGGQENELDEEEVNNLTCWMKEGEEELAKGGGVLMTGDHANPKPGGGQQSHNRLCPDKSEAEEFLGLGRALGRCVPRAGLLRKWEGPPTKRKKDSFNTLTQVSGIDQDGEQLEVDERPMQLLLATFDEKGNPSSSGGHTHPLFFYKGGKSIRVFPDHPHEGEVIIPTKFDEKEWPKRGKIWPRPRVIAHGIDHRNFRRLKIHAAYNGDRAEVGRIVADSTWHHYLNKNLDMFRSPAAEGSVADQIGQFYGNLAIWLSPLNKRREMANVMFYWLANHLFVVEELRLSDDQEDSDEVFELGRVAYSILSRITSPCEIHELLQAVIPNYFAENFEVLYFPDRGFSLSLFPSKEVLLGYIVDSYQQEINRIVSGQSPDTHLDGLGVAEAGVNKAFKAHVKKIKQAALDAQLACNVE